MNSWRCSVVAFGLPFTALLAHPQPDAWKAGAAGASEAAFTERLPPLRPIEKTGQTGKVQIPQTGLSGELQTAQDTQAWLKAAESGNVEAQAQVASMYYLGQGLPRDVISAAHWYRKAAQGGAPKAQTVLGIMYESGEGVPRDAREAARWFLKAAEQGDADAQGYLGLMYAVGDGVAEDTVQAYAWLLQARAGGNEQDSAPFQLLERGLTPQQIQEGERRAKRPHR